MAKQLLFEDHARAKEIFLAACELGPDERVELLEEACAGNAELRRRVEELLHFHEADGGVPTVEDLPASLPRLRAALEGRYRVVGEVGEGGMAIVYLAEDLTEGEPEFEETEDLEIRKMPLAAALSMVDAGEITDAISVAALLRIAAIRKVSSQ